MWDFEEVAKRLGDIIKHTKLSNELRFFQKAKAKVSIRDTRI